MSNEMITTVFDWEHFHLYLSGPIDFMERGEAADWRLKWTEKLCKIGFTKRQIFDLCRKPLHVAQFKFLDDEAALCEEHRNNKDWEGLCKTVDKIAHIDLRLVDKSDLILAYFPKTPTGRVPTYGTMHEVVVARQEKKPVYVVWEGGKETCSGWLMWLVGHQNVFGTIDELILHLDSIRKGMHPLNSDEWLLLDY